MYHLSQSVNNDKNRVIVVVFLLKKQRQSGHKVHGEVFPPMSWYRQGLQITIGLMSDRFQSQINVTSLDIDLDVLSQTRPIVFPADQLSCLVNTKILCKKIIVMTTYHLGTDDLWDVWESLELKHSLNVFPAIRKARKVSKKLYFFIVFLQLGES